MSTSQRSSSGVRNLRAVFEIADSSDSLSPHRGRSPSSSVAGSSSNTDKSPAPPPTRKVRSSFVAVDPSRPLNTTTSDFDPSTTPLRPKMSASLDAEPHTDVNPFAATRAEEATTSSAIPTAIAGLPGNATAQHPSTLASSQSETNTPGTGMVPQPAESPAPDAISQSAQSLPNGGAKPVAEAPKKTSTSAIASRPSKPRPSLNTAAGSKSSASQAKSSVSSKPPSAYKKTSTAEVKSPTQTSKPKSPTRPVRLSSHLTQPTASYSAKLEPEPPTTKPRSSSGSSKPIGVSSNLMAPTAASKAKHEPEQSTSAAKATTSSAKPRTSILPKRDRSSLAAAATTTTSSANRVARTSRASLASSSQQQPETKSKSSVKPTSQGFLARMTKPTSSTSSKLHDKAEPRSPPRPSAAPTHQSDTAPKPARPTSSKAPAASSPILSKNNSTVAKSPVTSKPANAAIVAATPTAEATPSLAQATPVEKPAPTEKAIPAVPGAPSETTVSSERTIPTENTAPAEVTTQSAGKSIEATPKASAAINGENKKSAPPQVDGASSAEQWNAAALPRTPQMKAEDAKTMTSKAVEQGRRSMMETPELESATIH